MKGVKHTIQLHNALHPQQCRTTFPGKHLVGAMSLQFSVLLQFQINILIVQSNILQLVSAVIKEECRERPTKISV